MKYTKQDKILMNAFVQAQKDIEHFYLQALREKNLQKAKYYAEKAKLVVQELQEEYQDWALTRWAEEYLKGFKEVEHLKRGAPKREQKLETNKIFLQVGKVHKEAVLALVQSGNRAVFATLDGMKRDITYWLALFNQKGKEIWLQHEIQSKLGAGLLTWKSLHYQKSDLVAFFQKKGLQLRDRSGRKRDHHTYAEMLIRTETARAYNAGMINRALELWTSKFRIEESWNCCSICAQYNGKVVDINKGGYDLPPYHPSCRWTVVPLWEEDWASARIQDTQLDPLFEKIGSNKKVAFIFDNSLSRETYDIMKSLNIAPEEYKHELSNHWLKHILRRHWEWKKLWKNELPVTKEEIKKIWIITRYADTTTLSDHTSKSWNKVIIYRKEMEGKKYSYLEFIDTKAGKLATQTMYINKK